MKLRYVAGVTLALGAVAAAVAKADTSLWIGERAMGTASGPPGWFVAAGSEFGKQQLPRWNSPVSLFQWALAGNTFLSNFSARPQVTEAGPDFGLGYVLREGALPPWAGQRVRVGVVGGFSSGSDSARQDYPFDNGRLFTFTNLAGTSTGFAAFTNAQPIFEELRVFRDSWKVGLRAATDFPLGADLVFTPQVTFYGGRATDTYNWSLTYTNVVFHSVNERIRTRELGGDFAAGLSWKARPWLTLNATGRIGVVSLASDMKGSDCAGSVCTPGTPQSQSVSDSRSVIALRTGGALGANFDTGGVVLLVSGFVTYDSKVPGIVNPTFFATPPVPQRAAHLRFDNGLRYGGLVNLRVPLFTGF